MSEIVDHDALDAALRRCGSSWNAGQAHGLLCSRLAVLGEDAGRGWLQQVLENTDADIASRQECVVMLDDLYSDTYRQLSDRQSNFEPLLPDDSCSTANRTVALAQWCEGFLHGLVSDATGAELRERLAAEPLSDIIKDMLEFTRASVEVDASDEADEEAYAELVEYLRVAAQLAYEELADLRRPRGNPEVLH